ncbi:transglycosylase SLT domain-containing protein [Leeia oryzae]|uniref:transglycosylase SLT domain-containing protein n=1 Tax=Leeia oryzae TaxID=356662 RepID=UPI000363C14C|nr:transglycosylase SLT domain-containing protein [Leeia oryzae]
MKSAYYSTRILLPAALFMACQLVRAGIPEDLTAARDAFRARDAGKLSQMASRLDTTLFAAYPRYWQLSLDIDNTTDDQIQDFLKHYPDTPLAEKLKMDWLGSLGRRQQWRNYLAYNWTFASEPVELACYRLTATLQQENRVDAAEVKSLWLSGSNQPKSCISLYSLLQAKGSSLLANPWARMRNALREARISKSDNLDAVRDANPFLPAKEQLDLKQLEQIYKSPQTWLDKQTAFPASQPAKETALFALNRQAMNDPSSAASTLAGWKDSMSPADRQYAWGLVGYWGAYNLVPDAVAWFKQAGDASLTDTQLAWKARAALRAKDWEQLLDAINAMGQKQATEPAWRYWKARALAQQGDLDNARTLYQDLAGEYNFYGLLAADELGQNLLNLKDQYKATEEEIKQVGQIPALQRALTLYQMDWKTEANREWTLSMRSMDDKQLLAAAELAKRNDWFDRAINTAEKTKTLHNFSLRFLSPYRQVMKSQTGRVGLDESWVFGLIRQESRFASVARSVVGAAGLMQLMPTTASWIAKKIGFAEYNPKGIHDIETNVLLGTSYLKYVLDSLGHPVLATAAYNAGPGRARAWLGGSPLEGAVYAESIPFDETRDYVKKVMSNAVFYAAVLGDPYVSLKRRMGIMPGRQ